MHFQRRNSAKKRCNVGTFSGLHPSSENTARASLICINAYVVTHIRTVILIQCVSKLPSLFCTRQPSKGLGVKAFWRLFYFLPFVLCIRKHPSAEHAGDTRLALCKRVLWICTRCSPCKREHWDCCEKVSSTTPLVELLTHQINIEY